MPGSPIIRLGLLACLGALAPAALAEDSPAGIQSLEWGTYPSPVAADDDAETIDVWHRIRQGFKIDEAADDNPLVATHVAWYSARPMHTRRVVERSRPFLHYIVEEIERRGMPMEIALLPMIESAFNPTALSPAEAAGIWQFIPSTGRVFGLRQDSWYDGRRDFTASTRAALDYLSKLYLDFGDWQLALAAYNCGEGCVARAIQRNIARGLPTDYASLSLPAETRHYVPKLLAMRQMVRTPEAFGVALAPLPNQPYFDKVTVHASMDVQSASRMAGVSVDEFLGLNAAFSRNLIRSDTPVNLLVPAGRAEAFKRNLEAGDWDRWEPYTVRSGERPAALAKRLGVSLDRLKTHNRFQLKRGKFARTQTILVPVANARTREARVEKPAAPTRSHTVRQGDTLFGIARAQGLAVAEVLDANPDLAAHSLQPGQILQLPDGSARLQPASQSTRKPSKPRQITVKAGDTLFAIAQRFNTTVAELKRKNPSARPSALRPGLRLTLP